MKTLKTLTLLTICVTSTALADDFKTIDGKEYKDVTVTRTEPDGIMVKTKSGITKLYFVELPKEVQQRLNYDPQKAAAFSAQESANYAASQHPQQKELEERQRQQDAAVAKGAEGQAAWNRSRNLQDRYLVLQQEENALQQQIDEARKPGPGYWGGYNHRKLLHHPNSEQSQIPLLTSRLQEVQREKNEVRQQLNKAQ